MTTTYYPQYSPAPPAFDRANGGHEFGYSEPRPVMQRNFPAAMPQPARPSRPPSALRSGVLLLGAVAAVGAGVLLGVTLFGEDGSDSTSARPVSVPGSDGGAVVLPTPTSAAPAAPAPDAVVIPGPSGVLLPRPNNDFTVTVPVPPAANPTPAPAPIPAPAPPPAPVQQAPGRILVPFQIKTEPEPPKPPTPAPPKADPPKPVPPAPVPGPVGPKGPGDSEYVLKEPPPVGPEGPGDTEVLLPKPGPKGPGDTELRLPKAVPAPPAPVPAAPEPPPCVGQLYCP